MFEGCFSLTNISVPEDYSDNVFCETDVTRDNKCNQDPSTSTGSGSKVDPSGKASSSTASSAELNSKPTNWLFMAVVSLILAVMLSFSL